MALPAVEISIRSIVSPLLGPLPMNIALVGFAAPAFVSAEVLVKSPKSTAFPKVAIVTKSIVLLADGVLPPANIQRLAFAAV